MRIQGLNSVKEALKSGREIEKIEIYKDLKKDKIEEIENLCKKKEIKIEYLDNRNKNSQGISAEIKDFNYYVELNEFLEKTTRMKKTVVLILDGVQDPGNFGALIRSSEALGVSGIIIPEKNSVDINETVIKTSTGAIEYVDIIKVVNISQTIESLKKLDFWIYGAEADGAINYDEEKYPDKTCLVLGSEGFGLRKKTKDYCDILIKIPMQGKINSLNVSVAGGILLSEIAKNRRV